MFENSEEAFGGTKPLLELIELIYASVQSPALWSLVLDRISEAARGESTILWAPFPTETLIAHARIDPFAWDSYVNYYASINTLSGRCDAMFPDGTVRYSHQAMSEHELEKTEFYSDFFSRNDMHHSFGVKVPLQNAPAAYMSCQRGKSKGVFTEREGLVYETLLPHLQRALSLHTEFTRVRSVSSGMESALEAFDHAIFGLDCEGRVAFSTEAAEAIAFAGDGLRVTNRMLSAAYPGQNASLQGMVAEAVAASNGAGLSAGGSLLIARGSGKPELRVTVMPFITQAGGSCVALSALVFINDPAKDAPSRSDALRALYGLSPTEARVAQALLDGLEVSALGDHLSMTLETARFHVKRVLAKTGTRRQPELIKMMLSLPGSATRP